MRLTKEQSRILEGKEGDILQYAMTALVKYGTAVGAEELIPIASAHTFFFLPRTIAQHFPPRRAQLTDDQVARFYEKLAKIHVRAKMTINPGIADFEKWRQIGAKEHTYNSLKQVVEACRKSGILVTWSCIPYLEDNTPVIGQHCSWSESSALIYCNSILGARSNRDGGEASFFSGLLGVTPNFGMHLDENRKGTHLFDVQCEMKTSTDWGALGYFAGTLAGDSIPVFNNLRRPTTEEAKQLGAAINVPGGAAMFHIVGVTPEAETLDMAFGGQKPKATFVFDEAAKQGVYQRVCHQPEGKVNMVFLGCPHSTLYEIKEISQLIEGKRVAKGTKLWVMTSHSIRASAERMGYAKVIEDAGGEVLADGCLFGYYDYTDADRPNLERIATDSVKQSLGARRSFRGNVFVGETKRCIQAAVEGGV